MDVAEAVLRSTGWGTSWEDASPKIIPVPRKSLDLGYESPLEVRMDPSRCSEVLGRMPLGLDAICDRVFHGMRR